MTGRCRGETEVITEEQWELIDKKYGMLMAKICHQISGDIAISSYDDNLQDLRMAAMNAVDGFCRQNGGANGKFNNFWGTKGFDKYIKTCLWTKKNNKGAKITKKYRITKNTVSIDTEETLNIESNNSNDVENSVFFDEIRGRLSSGEERVLNLVLGDHKLLKPNGRINVRRVSNFLGLTWADTNKIIKGLGNKIGNEL